jgi:hypothetical protein
MLTNETTPAAAMRTAVTSATRWKPSRSREPPTIAPRAAIVSRPATRETALFTADAMPERAGSIAPRIAAVSGETVIARPRPSTIIDGST